MRARHQAARRGAVRRLLALLATGTLAICGVKGPPQPPEAAPVEAAPDAGPAR